MNQPKKSAAGKPGTRSGQAGIPPQNCEHNNIPYADDNDIEPDNAPESSQPLLREDRLTPLCRENNFYSNRDSGFSSASSRSEDGSVTAYVSEDPGISQSNAGKSQQSCWTTSDLHTKILNCARYPTHDRYIPVNYLTARHLPGNFGDDRVVNLIKLKAVDVVRLSISYTSDDRPDDLGFKGMKEVRHGSGTAFVYNMRIPEPCDCKAGPAGHLASGLFRVMTVSHVVFNDREAQKTNVEFFYDSTDSSKIVQAWGVRVFSVDIERNRSIIECRTHDLNLWKVLENAKQERNKLTKLIEKDLAKKFRTEAMAVLISHPHGMCKQVSVGILKNLSTSGTVKTLKEGVKLIDCILTYDTPTCSGSGGGPVNVFGMGTTNYALAPHCASKKTGGENFSGLGWARVFRD